LIKKFLIIFNIFFISIFLINNSLADVQKDIINKLTGIQTLSFDFKQTISDKEEFGNCFIKYPLLMRCNYNNLKKKIIISNGKKLAVIKKKYKKIYSYPLKKTPLYFFLRKEEIINLVRKNKPSGIDSDLIEFQFKEKKKDRLKVFFGKDLLEFKGWETIDAYSNKVTFSINNLIINNSISDNLFKIPKEEDL
jgi:outer membrane lipoprotein-sorting protein